jgi:outer membrane autotransporter protein
MLGISARTDYDALDGFDAFESSTSGFVIGTDHRIGDEWLVGGSIGAGDTRVDVSDLADGGIDSWQASLYATWFNDRWHVEGGASVGKQDFSNRRQLVVDNELGSVQSAHGGSVMSAFLGGGTRLGDDRLMIEPYFSLNYFDSREERFEEGDASGINQLVQSNVNAAFFGEAGFKFSALQKTAHSLIDWHFNLGLSHDFEIDDANVTFSYAGAMGNWFTLDARKSDPNSHLFGAGVTLMKKDSAFTLEYRGLMNDDHEEQYLGARVSLRF